MSHCIINKRKTFASSYIICPFPDFNWSIKSLATFGLAQQGAVCVNTRQSVGTLSASKGTVIASVMAVNGEHKEHHNAR